MKSHKRLSCESKIKKCYNNLYFPRSQIGYFGSSSVKHVEQITAKSAFYFWTNWTQ